MAPEERFVPRFAAEPPQEDLPYGRWQERLREELLGAVAELETDGAELGEPFVTAGLCLYRDGRDSVAWHGDTFGRGLTHDTMVAIVSVGSPRALLLRPRGGGSALRYEVGHGDLIVMGGSCQRTWEHAVPKTARAVGPTPALSGAIGTSRQPRTSRPSSPTIRWTISTARSRSSWSRGRKAMPAA